MVERAVREGLPVYASRDWHPPVTAHFQEHGGPWPVHCVRDTAGAQFHPDLRLPPGAILISKGVDPAAHGYSAFEGTTPEGVALAEDLRRRGVGHLIIGGIATDYCVKQSVLDARRHGLEVTVLRDGIAGVDVTAGDAARAIEEMKGAGARIA
jgi:nicotinamidase/pyrazinamidase